MNYEADFLNLLIRHDLINVYQMDVECQQELWRCKDDSDFRNFSEFFVIKHNVEVSQKIALNDFLDACYGIANKNKTLWEVPLIIGVN